jgi:hypothetical protein
MKQITSGLRLARNKAALGELIGKPTAADHAISPPHK